LGGLTGSFGESPVCWSRHPLPPLAPEWSGPDPRLSQPRTYRAAVSVPGTGPTSPEGLLPPPRPDQLAGQRTPALGYGPPPPPLPALVPLADPAPSPGASLSLRFIGMHRNAPHRRRSIDAPRLVDLAAVVPHELLPPDRTRRATAGEHQRHALKRAGCDARSPQNSGALCLVQHLRT
jgi:hypothetical protein